MDGLEGKAPQHWNLAQTSWHVHQQVLPESCFAGGLSLDRCIEFQV